MATTYNKFTDIEYDLAKRFAVLGMTHAGYLEFTPRMELKKIRRKIQYTVNGIPYVNWEGKHLPIDYMLFTSPHPKRFKPRWS